MEGGGTLREMVFKAFLKNPSLGPSQMAERLKANYNSVKAIYAKLCEDGLLRREGRGNYSPNVSGILLHLLKRIEALERGGG
jgi:Mn-dependent DtxR family transcriptional regulator